MMLDKIISYGAQQPAAYGSRPSARSRMIGFLVAGLTCLALAGCLERRCAWSPDGRWLAVLGDGALRFSGPDGTLSPAGLTVGGSWGTVVWRDDRRLLVTGSLTARTWEDVAPHLQPDERAALETDAWRLADGFLRHRGTGDWADSLPLLFDPSLLAMFLRDRGGPDLLARFKALVEEKDWTEFTTTTVNMARLIAVTWDGTTVREERTWCTIPGRNIVAVVPQPGGEALAVVSDLMLGDRIGLRLHLVQPQGTRILADTLASPAVWSVDGRSLRCFVRAAGPLAEPSPSRESGVARVSETPIATLIEVPTTVEQPSQAHAPKVLALAHVKEWTDLCRLPNGDLLFASAIMGLPCCGEDLNVIGGQDLFQLRADGKGPLQRVLTEAEARRLPSPVLALVPNPDGTRLLALGNDYHLVLVDLASSTTRTVQEALPDRPTRNGPLQTPVWRSAVEFTAVVKDGDRHELALWAIGGDRTDWGVRRTALLSRAWPADQRRRWLDAHE